MFQNKKEYIIKSFYASPDLVRLTNEQFEKAIQNEKLEVFTPEAIVSFTKDVRNGRDLQEIEKAKKDLSKLTKVKVTDKNGHSVYRWVRRGEEPKGSISTDDKHSASSSDKNLKEIINKHKWKKIFENSENDKALRAWDEKKLQDTVQSLIKEGQDVKKEPLSKFIGELKRRQNLDSNSEENVKRGY